MVSLVSNMLLLFKVINWSLWSDLYLDIAFNHICAMLKSHSWSVLPEAQSVTKYFRDSGGYISTTDSAKRDKKQIDVVLRHSQLKATPNTAWWARASPFTTAHPNACHSFSLASLPADGCWMGPIQAWVCLAHHCTGLLNLAELLISSSLEVTCYSCDLGCLSVTGMVTQPSSGSATELFEKEVGSLFWGESSC